MFVMSFSKKPPIRNFLMSQDCNDDFGTRCVCTSLNLGIVPSVSLWLLELYDKYFYKQLGGNKINIKTSYLY